MNLFIQNIGESVLNLKDFFMILGGVVGILIAFFTVKFGLIKLSEQVEIHIENVKAELEEQKKAREIGLKEVCRNRERSETLIHERINKMNNKVDQLQVATNNEFKAINRELGEIKTGIESIKSLLAK